MSMSKTTISVLNALINVIVTFFKYKICKYEDAKVKKEQIREALNNLDEACRSGSISDLLDITQKIGEANK